MNMTVKLINGAVWRNGKLIYSTTYISAIFHAKDEKPREVVTPGEIMRE